MDFPLILTFSRKRLCRNTVHGSRTSPRTVLLDSEFNYLSARPKHVEGLRVNCDTVSKGRRNSISAAAKNMTWRKSVATIRLTRHRRSSV